MLHLGIFAQTDPAGDLLNPGTNPFSEFKGTDTLIILGFIFVLVIALFSWAYFIRQRSTENQGAHTLVRTPRRPRRSRSRSGHADKAPKSSENTDSNRVERVRRRRRRRTQEELPRNPTLGETGGLPPQRSNDPDGSSPSSESPA